MQNIGVGEDIYTFKAATGLSGGMGRTGDCVCGAFSGGVLAIGLVYGRDKLETSSQSEGYKDTMNRVAKFYDRFKEEYGSTRCHDVQLKVYGKTWDLRDPVVYEEFHDYTSKTVNRCLDIERRAAELAAEVILES